MRRAIPPVPHTSSWHGAYLSTGKFTFNLYDAKCLNEHSYNNRRFWTHGRF